MSYLLALLSAAFFAGNAICVRLALRGSSAATAVLVSLITNLGGLWLLAALRGSLAHVLTSASLVFVLAGVFAPALARLTLYKSIDIIGVARATTISNTTPIFSAILAVPFLGETLSWRVALGTVLVVVGVALTVRPEGEVVSAAHPAGRRGRFRGALLALNTALLASISFLLRKIGLRLLPDPVLGAALTVTSSLAVVAPFIAARWRREPLRADRGSLGTLIAGGLLSTGGFLSYYLALNLGDVVRVTPLSNTTPLFALVLLFTFRQVEQLVPSVVVGALLAVAGVVLVVAG